MSDETPKPDTMVMLKGVRLSFPDLFTAVQYEGKGPFNYRATVLVEPGSQNDKTIRAAIKKAADNKWEKKAAEVLKTIEGQSQKFCYINGDQKAYDGYAGMMALTMGRPQESGPPLVMDKDKSRLTAEDGRIYGGCYVNIKGSVWAQDNKFGRAIRCSLVAVQFHSDGESFGGAPQANDDGFEVEEDESEEYV